jgi:hypothetical protein
LVIQSMSRLKLVRCAPLFVLLTLGGLRAEARGAAGIETSQDLDLTSHVQSDSQTTYLDLLRKLFPDIHADSTAHTTIPIRSISEPRKREPLTGDITFDFKPYWFRSEGRRLLLLWVDLKSDEANVGTPYEGEAVVLAVYSLEPSARMLDAMEVKTDRFTGFLKDRAALPLDRRNDAFVIYSTHWNAGESYMSIETLFVDAGRLKTIASLFIYETQGCGANFTEAPSFRAAADPGRKYPKVFVKVKLKKGADEDGCEPPSRGYTKYFQGLYRWDASKGRYESNSRQLERLDRFNERRL